MSFIFILLSIETEIVQVFLSLTSKRYIFNVLQSSLGSCSASGHVSFLGQY